MAGLGDGAAESKALEGLVEDERRRERLGSRGGPGHAQRDADQHAVQRDAQLQHL